MGSVNQFYRGCLCANISSLLKSAVFNRYRPYDSCIWRLGSIQRKQTVWWLYTVPHSLYLISYRYHIVRKESTYKMASVCQLAMYRISSINTLVKSNLYVCHNFCCPCQTMFISKVIMRLNTISLWATVVTKQIASVAISLLAHMVA